MTPRILPLAAMRARVRAIRAAPPAESAALYRALSSLLLEPPPEAAALRALDPFGAEYAAAAMALMDRLRGRPYDPARDERIGHGMGDRDLWTGLSPFEFRDPLMLAEFLDAHAALLRQIGAPPGAEVLEYGPGTGHFLLTLARLGYRCHAVDLEPEYLALVSRQAAAMGLDVAREEGRFGEGFGEKRFDCVFFFEAFHHAPDFLSLLRRLRRRVKPGGRLLLCGEPLLPDGATDGVLPYPWGPRLDGVAFEAIERGWMELGFQLTFLLRAFQRTGWHPTFLPSPTFRAHLIAASVNEDFHEPP